ASDDGERVVRRLGRQLTSTFDGVESHVPTTAVQAAVRQAMADDVDLLVSFGGGSCADLGKAVCFFVEQQAGTPGASYADRPALVDDPVDVEARTGMLTAAVLGGRCLQNAGMGVHHGLAQLVGGRTGMAHGLANAVLLAHAVRFNAGDPALYEPLAKIGAALGDEADPAGAIDRLRERLGLPAGLSDCGMTDEDLDAVVRM